RRVGSPRSAGLGWNFAAAGVLLDGEIGAAGNVAQSGRQGRSRGAGAASVRGDRARETGFGGCTRARGLDDATHAAGVFDVDGAVLAGAARGVCAGVAKEGWHLAEWC